MGIERPEVVCPFYRYDDGQRRIVCEGLYNSSTLTQRFDTKKVYEQQLEHYCFRHCMECGLFRMLMREKYAEA